MMKRTILSLLFGTASMFAMAQSQTVSHVVQRGETLESIAEYYNVRRLTLIWMGGCMWG